MNKKGQMLLLSIVFGLIIFIILYGSFLGEWSNSWTEKAITDNSLTGIEAFLLKNFQLWIFIGLLIGILYIVYFGGRG